MIPELRGVHDSDIIEMIREYSESDVDSKRASDLADLLDDITEMGRSRNPKKDRLEQVIRDWNPVDAYIAIRALDGNQFANPGESLDFGGVLEREAVASAYFDGDASKLQTVVDEHGSLSRALRAEEISVSSSVAEDPMLETLYAKLVELATTSSEHQIRTGIEQTIQTMEHPWVFTFMLEDDLPTYLGTSMIQGAISQATEFSAEEVSAARAVTDDIGIVFCDAVDGSLKMTLEPHDLHATMKAKSVDDRETVADDEWIAETKYDGARMFIHKDAMGELTAYTGGNIDVTDALPELTEMNWPAKSFIFDAEVVGYDPETGEVKPFQSIMERLTRTGGVDVARKQTEARLKVFDCLYWDGEDIREQPYEERRKHVISNFLPPQIAQAGSDLDATFQRSLEENHEGVVLKRKGHLLELNSRSSDWRKWKAEPETVDLKVTDADRGSGDMSDMLGALHVAAEYEAGGVIDLGCVGTGFSREDREELWSMHERGSLVGSIVEVDFEELQENSDGWGLRFPRFKRLRPDTSSPEVETFSRLKEIAKVSES